MKKLDPQLIIKNIGIIKELNPSSLLALTEAVDNDLVKDAIVSLIDSTKYKAAPFFASNQYWREHLDSQKDSLNHKVLMRAIFAKNKDAVTYLINEKGVEPNWEKISKLFDPEELELFKEVS